MPQLDGPRWGPASGRPAEQLVVICHGVGADGNDLIGLAPAWGQALPNAVFAAPHAPDPYDMLPPGYGHEHGHGPDGIGPRQWFSLADRTPSRLLAGVGNAAPLLDAFIDAELARHNLPADALALVGFSQGAMTVLHAGLRRPTPPRAVLAYSGAMLTAEGIRNLAPVLLVHGQGDEVVPFARGPAAERALRAAGVPVEVLWCPGLGHGIDGAGVAAGGRFLRRAFAAG